jgi:phosphatidylglycerol:prolipoprotein diacylglycerol transferase
VIPYVEVYDLQIGPMTFSVFGLLVAVAIFGGAELARWRARRLGLDVKAVTSLEWWVVVVGFLTAHVFDELCYHLDKFVERPWTILVPFLGISSFGGFLGCALGALGWKYVEWRRWFALGDLTVRRPALRAEPRPILATGDPTIAASFPAAWVFGRLACALVHDHPGARATASSPLAVAFGPGPKTAYGFFALHWGTSPRYDLGLLELMFTVLVAVVFALMWRRRWPAGTYTAASMIVYAPVRFLLDVLRADDAEGGDPRYGGLTPGQWSAIAMFAGGLALAWVVRTAGAAAVTPGTPASGTGSAPSRS